MASSGRGCGGEGHAYASSRGASRALTPSASYQWRALVPKRATVLCPCPRPVWRAVPGAGSQRPMERLAGRLRPQASLAGRLGLRRGDTPLEQLRVPQGLVATETANGQTRLRAHGAALLLASRHRAELSHGGRPAQGADAAEPVSQPTASTPRPARRQGGEEERAAHTRNPPVYPLRPQRVVDAL